MEYNKYKDESNPKFIAHHREKDGEKQFLEEHLEEASVLAGKFAKKIGLEKHGELIGLLHDLGKATFEFYQYIGSATGLIDPDEDDYIDASGKKGKIDHSSAGAQVIYNYFSGINKESAFASQILSLIIASHHSGLIDCLSPDGIDNYSRRMKKSDEKTRTKEALTNVNDIIKRKMEKILSDGNFISDFNLKLKSLQEFNDSDDTFMFKAGLLTKFLFSCLVDADRLNTADFEFPERLKLRNQGDYVPWQILIDKLEKHLSDLENKTEIKNEEQKRVNKLRKEISDHCLKFSEQPKGLYQLTVPTGGGKTLSSLRFALNHVNHHEMDRIIYVIPYTSIIDQNAETVRKIMVGEIEQVTDMREVVLEHHSNLTPEEETTRQKLLAENWDAPIVFTTMVQLLETLFGYGTRSGRRMHQLANTVIIFDEIQTLPVQCVYLFNIAVRFLLKTCGSTVILCTATQPLLNSEILGNKALSIGPQQQMISDVRKLFEDLRRVEVFDRCKVGGWTIEEIADLVETELKETGSVLAIVNTKNSASALFQQVRNNPKAKVYHLSTNMCPAHRLQYLQEIKDCLANEQPVICISTQLIEAGVDIDFGSVIRYLAGLDSIAQAAGRCNRNGARPQRGRVFIVNPLVEKLNKLTDIKIGRKKAERILEEFKTDSAQFEEDILGLKAMERYYQYYFYERKEDMSYVVGPKSEAGRLDNLFGLLATNPNSVQEYQRVNSVSPETFLRQSFMTAAKIFQAIDSRTQGVIVPYGEGNRIISELCEVKDLHTQYHLLKEAQRYSVNVYCNQFDELIKQKIMHEVQEGAGIFYLDKQYYSKEYGMSESKVNEMETLTC
ncbi:metal dependent phosphohydrolase [Syntrophobotulus glycolicus DSM 8271]|uniref:Metal dependent phosphohydrolase n=1 Tax=Syntrophobotulus glycolicus (strain DSM 8271 / FlGlyR) TaxID=645991 RepID=F0T1Y2_SYNGF|nr:CRISPR-associated helicase/endonuclease Cas3 [Syntrophobotulus glycolicus]ADY55246.1 metal dependent phosphohydrolase [Syntrophobotulus glycolicus DSM 8271]